MPDEDFTSIEAALQVVEKFASRLTIGDAEGHVRRSNRLRWVEGGACIS
jgi:hypothetical protein